MTVSFFWGSRGVGIVDVDVDGRHDPNASVGATQGEIW